MKILIRSVLYSFCLLGLLSGCATTSQKEDHVQAVSAAEKVLSAVSGQDVDEKKLREINRTMQKDPQAKSAVETIANSVSGQGRIIKYCPVDGQRYGAKFTECPDHKVLLKILND